MLLVLAVQPARPGEELLSEVAYSIVDDPVLKGIASPKVDKVVASASENVCEKLVTVLTKAGLASIPFDVISDKSEAFEVFVATVECAWLKAALLAARSILAVVAEAFPDSAPPATLSQAAALVGATVVLASGSMNASSSIALTCVAILRAMRRSGILPPQYEPKEDTAGDSTVVVVRGVAHTTSARDIAAWLAPLTTANIKFAAPPGTVFLQFNNAADAKAALGNHLTQLDSRTLEVFLSSPAEMGAAVSAPAPAPPPASHTLTSDAIVKMRGLPFGASPRDIQDFFKDISLREEDIHLTKTYDGRMSGEAFVVLPSESDIRKAMAHNREKIGSRYIELFDSDREELQFALKPRGVSSDHRRGDGGYGSGYAPAPASGYAAAPSAAPYGSTPTFARLRGLPFTCSEQDIIDFFADVRLAIPLVASDVFIQYNSQGRRSGEAYVKFASREDFVRGQGKQRAVLGRRYIEIFEASPSDVAKLDVGTQGKGYGSSGGGGAYGGTPHPSSSQGPPDSRVYTAGAYDAGYAAYYGSGRGSSAPGGYGGGPEPPRATTVRCVGFPLSATEQDIAGYMRDYRVNPASIRVAFGPDGRPTGEAYVAFSTLPEAESAVRYYSAVPYGPNRITLYIV